ncbi:MAG: transketolase [Pseudomonadota bacterium]
MDARSKELRKTILAMLWAGGRGHLAPALSVVEILRVLYDDVLRYDAGRPEEPDRDRCVLSKGHGCMALYAILADKGFFPRTELQRFCKADGILGGHPERGKVPGVEASTGSLGHGLPIGVGMALSARLDRSSRRVFVVLGDGEANEGSNWEGALCAAKHRLDNLTVIVDRNHQQSYGDTCEVLDIEPFADKWRSFGWEPRDVDGHDVAALRSALASLPLAPAKPSALICHTVKGKGIASVERNLAWHHKNALTDNEYHDLVHQVDTYHA